MQIFDMLNDFKTVTGKIKSDKSFYWILANVNEINSIRKQFVLDDESISECMDEEQPSKISFFNDYIFMVLNVLEYNFTSVTAKELDIFLAKEYIITVYKDEISIINNFIKDIYDSKNCLILKNKPETYILFYYLLDRIIVRNYDVISALEAEADEIEINVLKNPRHSQIEQLIYLRRQVYKIRKYLNPLRYIGDSLISNENSIIKKEDLHYFHSLTNKIDKLMLSLESLVQDLALVREAFESEISNKTNELMKIFTTIATIFLPLNLISSMHGMNFKYVPLTHLDYGYYYLVCLMIVISLLLVRLFKKRGWL